VRYVLSGGLAGVLAGIVFLGLGSRAVMRISALLNPDAGGILTENGNRIGEITAGGTIELILFEGLFGGLLAGALWVIVREWLPAQRGPRICLAGIVSALLGSFLVISAENRDFDLLEMPGLQAAMFIAIVGLTGCGAATIDERVRRVLQAGPRATFGFTVLLLLGGALSLPILAQAFLSEEVCVCSEPPRLALAFIALAAIATAVHWAASLGSGGPPGARLRLLGTAGVLGACLVAGLDLISEVREIV
jgi:hypothetical protein